MEDLTIFDPDQLEEKADLLRSQAYKAEAEGDHQTAKNAYSHASILEQQRYRTARSIYARSDAALNCVWDLIHAGKADEFNLTSQRFLSEGELTSRVHDEITDVVANLGLFFG